jgi:hypothetical protein
MEVKKRAEKETSDEGRKTVSKQSKGLSPESTDG